VYASPRCRTRTTSATSDEVREWTARLRREQDLEGELERRRQEQEAAAAVARRERERQAAEDIARRHAAEEAERRKHPGYLARKLAEVEAKLGELLGPKRL
jgi:hypothetical protein